MKTFIQYLESAMTNIQERHILSRLAWVIAIGRTNLSSVDIQEMQKGIDDKSIDDPQPIDWQFVETNLRGWIEITLRGMRGGRSDDEEKIRERASHLSDTVGTPIIVELRKHLKDPAKPSPLSTDDLYKFLGGKPGKQGKFDSEGGFSLN